LGIKIDSIPGRFNYVQTYINRESLFYGQCSELCGLAHSYMPIVVESVSFKKFIIFSIGKTIIDYKPTAEDLANVNSFKLDALKLDWSDLDLKKLSVSKLE